ncbi:hypothetical protein [Roseibacillus persicicus]|uniref:hypothetical protein n=1 Tax=Roseibacillus persicicus TaxID=454148 RepID=UPI0016796112|nr:hypothetical protein [Roseibacillus persicicus]
MDQLKDLCRWSKVGWWTAWFLIFVASLLPPLVYWWASLEERIEPLRYSWGLTPAELLFLRYFSRVSYCIPLILVGLFLLAIKLRKNRKSLLVLGSLLTTIFTSFYLGYCLIVLSMYLSGYATVIETSRKETAGPSATNADQGVPAKSEHSGG